MGVMKTIAFTLLLVAAMLPIGNVSLSQAAQQADTPPVPTFYPNPPYTDEARANKISGQVLLEILVRADGSVDPAIVVVRGLGFGLDENAVETLRQWKFKPATRDGKPVDVRIPIEVTFRTL